MARGARGLPCAISGMEELAQQALIRLSVKQGSFLQDAALGSRLHTLSSAGTANLELAALNLVRQALLPLAGLEVRAVRCTRRAENLALAIELAAGDEKKTLEVTVNP